jgi:3-methyladenine DNA glycosylase AlkC
MPETFSLKDQLFNAAKVEKIAREIRAQHRAFKKQSFEQEVLASFPELELKARIAWISECLHKYLPSNFRQAVSVLLRALPPANDRSRSDDDFGDFIYAPYGDYVARYGRAREHLQFSLAALYEITQRFSAEDAIRYFLNAYPKETLEILLEWAKDEHYHVRRLCSEGTRPKLPWSQKIGIAVSDPIRILDRLYFDRTRYVTRSVANHLNDISKTDPELVIATLTRWRKTGRQNPTEMDYMARHALRTLVKAGHPGALHQLGYSHAAQVSVTKFTVPLQVEMNKPLEFSFTLSAKETTRLVVDYVLYFQNKAGQMSNRKVFKLKQLQLQDSESTVIAKRHLLRENMSTRTLYPGIHAVEVQVNGKALAKKTFMLTSARNLASGG